MNDQVNDIIPGIIIIIIIIIIITNTNEVTPWNID